MIEVELKFKLPTDSLAAMEAYLATRTTRGSARRLHNTDTYYDTPAFALLRQAVFVRVRNQQYLEFKFNEKATSAHIHCTERVFSLTPDPRQAAGMKDMNHLFSGFLPDWRDENTVHDALHHNGMIELAHIENQRMEYTSENLLLCLDQVEGLGNFLEIEMRCEEEREIEQAVSQVLTFAADIKAVRLRIGYVEMWLQHYHPEAYRLGKYQEEPVLDGHSAR